MIACTAFIVYIYKNINIYIYTQLLEHKFLKTF